MTRLTIELPDNETKLLKQLLKKMDGKVIQASKQPNQSTLSAMRELKAGKGVGFESVEQLFKSI